MRRYRFLKEIKVAYNKLFKKKKIEIQRTNLSV